MSETNETKVLDAGVLDDLIEHIGPEAAWAVIELFIGESRQLAAAMGIAGNDRDIVRRAAHSLKSSAGQLGAAALAEVALAVEIAAETDSPDLPHHVAVLADCAVRTEAALAVRLKA